MFSLPYDVRGLIWARVRFVNRRTKVNALLQTRPRPAYHHPYMCIVLLQISATRVMWLSVAWHLNVLAYSLVAEEGEIPVSVWQVIA